MVALWNSQTGEFLGRTGISWVKIVVFYVVYYTLLHIFFMVYLFIFFQTIDPKIPKWQTNESLIGENPGVGFRPSPEYIESTLIWFRSGDDNGSWQPLVDQLEKFLEPYENGADVSTDEDGKESMVDCGIHEPKENQVCKVNTWELFQSDCTKGNKFGYRAGRPCILLKLNKIYGWVPECYNTSQIPYNLPEEIQTIMGNLNSSQDDANRKVWIQCRGQNTADVENIGEIVYYPSQGFSANLFPYLNQPGYISPVVFMQLKNPQKGVIIGIECRAYAYNIHHHVMERQGLVRFEVMID